MKAEVLEASEIIYNLLNEKGIDYIDSSLSDGGIGFEFNYKNTYYNFKIDNDLDAIFYIEEKNKLPQGWDLTFEELINKIKLCLL